MDILHVQEPFARAYLSDYSQRDAKWDQKRSETQDVAATYSQHSDFRSLAARMDDCAKALWFRWSEPDAMTGETRLKLKNASFCRARHCQVCSWRRSMRNTARFFSKLPELATAYPTHRWLFLTLTVKNCALADLRSTIQAMNAGWQRLIKRKDWPALGWLRSVEVTRGADGSAHPHFHCLLMVQASYFSGQKYVTKKDWSDRWRASARLEYDPVIDIRTVKPKIAGQTLQAAVVETLKYGTKTSDLTGHAEWLYAITEQLHKMRFLASGGVLKHILKEDLTDQEMIAGDEVSTDAEDDAPALYFDWRRSERRYKRKTV